MGTVRRVCPNVKYWRSPSMALRWAAGRGHSTLSDTCCQIHKARNIMDRLPKSMRAQVRRVLRQAWELDDAGKAETLLRNPARRLEKDWEGVSASILEGLDEMLTVTKLGLPPELRRSLACTTSSRIHGHGAARLPERKILALTFDGSALGRRGHAGSRQGV